MANPEVHVHINIYGDQPDPDVATHHSYPKQVSLAPSNKDQLSFEDPIPVSPAPAPQGSSAAGVPITPQIPGAQRAEIAHSSKRNEHLANLDEKFGMYKSRDSRLKQAKAGLVKLGRAEQKNMQKNRDELKGEAKEELYQACGNCALNCAIRENFPKWARMHESANTSTPHSEARETWRKRLLKDPNAHCIPPKLNK